MTRRALLLLAVGIIAWGYQKPKKEELTQVLDLPKDPPFVASGPSRRLVFHVSPLSTNGLLSQQTKDAVKALQKLNGNAQFIHIRAFVAGNGDVRRVPQIISDVLTDKHQALPAISVIRAGGLSLENSQVVLEAVSLAKKDVNPGSIDFAESGAVTAPDVSAPARPLLDKALDQLAAKSPAAATLRVTCFVSSMDTNLTGVVSAKFPKAVVNVVKSQRGPYQGLAACQAVRQGEGPAGKLAFTGTRVAFGSEEKDARLAFQRLDKDLAEAGAAPDSVVFTNIYPLSGAMAELSKRLRPSKAPVAVILSEGVAAVEAGFAVDAVAVTGN